MEQETEENAEDHENQSVGEDEPDAKPESEPEPEERQRDFKDDDMEEDDVVWNIKRSIDFIFCFGTNSAMIYRHTFIARSIYTLNAFPDVSSITRPFSITNIFVCKITLKSRTLFHS